MMLTAEGECPQCGAPITLTDAVRLIRCSSCGVRSHIAPPRLFRFLLPAQTQKEEEGLFHVPYVRFAGSVFTCEGDDIAFRAVDVTRAGAEIPGLPPSLGMRPQAMRLAFASPRTPGRYLPLTTKVAGILSSDGGSMPWDSTAPVYFRTVIGRTMSIVYLPVCIRGETIQDGVTGDVLGRISGTTAFDRAVTYRPSWSPVFLPALCPDCGWELYGDGASVVLACRNCSSAWEARQGKYVRVEAVTVPSRSMGCIHLPFWRIRASGTGKEISDFADLLRATGTLIGSGADQGNSPIVFWAPAFHVRPKRYLRLCTSLTMYRDEIDAKTVEAAPARSVPVTMPRSEAVRTLKLTLVGVASNKRDLFPLLPGIRFRIHAAHLVYLPFFETGYDLVLEGREVAVEKRGLI
ncbi:MAG: hypothetical protein K6360_06720 [Deltaproteobacteria bacterium]